MIKEAPGSFSEGFRMYVFPVVTATGNIFRHEGKKKQLKKEGRREVEKMERKFGFDAHPERNHGREVEGANSCTNSKWNTVAVRVDVSAHVLDGLSHHER
jgi:hypothetical protein